jgi:hypothetical protein
MQLFEVNFILFYCRITLHVSGVVHTHHQEKHKTVTTASGTGQISLQLPSSNVALGHVGGR